VLQEAEVLKLINRNKICGEVERNVKRQDNKKVSTKLTNSEKTLLALIKRK
jgi:hypothetical protein